MKLTVIRKISLNPDLNKINETIDSNISLSKALENKRTQLEEREFDLDLYHQTLLKWENTLARKEKDVQTKINILKNKELRKLSKIYAKSSPKEEEVKE